MDDVADKPEFVTEIPLRVKRLYPTAILPSRATPGAAGYDLHIYDACTLQPGERQLIGTGISICLPPNTYGRIAPRSGLSLKGIDIAGGVVDGDYTGEIKIIVVNNSKKEKIFQATTALAQLIIERILTPPIVLVKELEITKRGDNGFGSTDSLKTN